MKKLTDNPATDVAFGWSPDETQIVFVSDRDGNYEIYTMEADGSHQVNLSNDPGIDIFPIWQPDINP